MEAKKSRGGWVVAGLLVAVFVAVVYISMAEGEPITVDTVRDPIVRGARLNHSALDANGVVSTAPYALLGEAVEVLGRDISEDVYALARSGRSEGVDGMEARMHVMLNQADAAGLSVYQLTVRSTHASADGYYGEQAGRRWASSRDPYAGDVELAERAIADHAAGVDPTGGAGRFYDVSGFGRQAGTGAEEAKRAEWLAEGYAPYHYPGASDDFVLWRRGGVPDGFPAAFA